MSEDTRVAGNGRYARQVLIPEIGMEGQGKLRRTRVSVCGVGGLGTPTAQYLVAAGIGILRLIDPDPVELTNLNRQILHWDEDCECSAPKVESAAWKLRRMSGDTEVQVIPEAIGPSNVSLLLGGSDIVVDCLDNFEARFVVNEFCVRNGIPLVHAAVEDWRGQATVVIPKVTPCLACLVKRPPVVKRPIPILGTTAGFFGCLEASETVKLAMGIKGGLAGKLFVADMKDMVFDVIDIERDPDCPVCGTR